MLSLKVKNLFLNFIEKEMILKVKKVKVLVLFMIISVLSLFALNIDFSSYNLNYVNGKALVVVYKTDSEYQILQNKLSEIVNDVNFIPSSELATISYFIVNQNGSYEQLKDTRLSAVKEKLYGDNQEVLSIEDSSWGQIKDLFR